VIHAISPVGAKVYPGMSHAVRVGDLMFLSGQVSVDAGGTLVGEGDPLAQVRQCFHNIEALLRAGGGGLDSVVKLTCYLADAGTYPVYASVKAELFARRPPVGTVVIVGALLDPRFLLEIEATAVLDESSTLPSTKEPS
jgi:enamine deaminase RidA (YjgF/YER057c/UK114 family)